MHVRTAAEQAGFAEVRPVIEVRGICADCGLTRGNYPFDSPIKRR